MNPPVAPKHPHPHTLHGDVRPDDYYWLNDKQNPDVIAYLEAENQYFGEHMQPLRALEETLYEDMLARIPEAEEHVPAQHGPYFYYDRIAPGSEYPTYYRRRAADRASLSQADEEVVLDVNQLAEAGGFLSVTTLLMSPDHQRVAYLENRDGTDRYTLYIKDLASGEFLDAPIPNVFLADSIAWDAQGTHMFYLLVDDAQRPFQLWRHRLGTPAAEDVLLYQEDDVTFTLSLSTARSGRYLFLSSDTNTTSEVRFAAADQPESVWTLYQPRRTGIIYHLEHWNGQLLNLTNEGAENYTVLTVPEGHPDPSQQTPLVPYVPSRYWQAVLPFGEGILISGREDGLTQLWIYQAGTLRRLEWDEPLYTVFPGRNLDYHTSELLVRYQSLLTPPCDYAINIRTGTRTLLREEPVRNYDRSRYSQRQLWATADDGTRIPVSLVAAQSTWESATPAPTVLYGYGSYGANSNPTFDATRLPLLDRGMIYAIAHVRGGSEMGDHWYQDGKLLNKRHTFTDFIAVARHLIDQGCTTPSQLAARGRSAGGLLMGAILNMRPDLFQVVAPGVPFVDVVTTMLDASIPLTTLEWDEWGNPQDPDYYQYMKSYSPYDNVTAQDYPHMYVYTGLNDPRVGYFEPAKWVARLRDTKTDHNVLVLKTLMGAGHGGASGRHAHIHELAEEYAFILDKLGVRQP